MVELIKSRAVLSGVGYSTLPANGKERIIDRILDKRYTLNDAEDVANHLEKLVTVTTNKETGTVTIAVEHPDSALARLMASRIVDSASQILCALQRRRHSSSVLHRKAESQTRRRNWRRRGQAARIQLCESGVAALLHSRARARSSGSRRSAGRTGLHAGGNGARGCVRKRARGDADRGDAGSASAQSSQGSEAHNNEDRDRSRRDFHPAFTRSDSRRPYRTASPTVR